MCYAKDYLERLKRIANDIDKCHKEYSRKLSALDRKVSEKYHEIETKKFNAAEGYYLAK